MEQPSGRGWLVGDAVEANATYTFRVTQETIRPRHFGDPGATLPGLQHIDGQLKFDDSKQEAGLLGENSFSIWKMGDG